MYVFYYIFISLLGQKDRYCYYFLVFILEIFLNHYGENNQKHFFFVFVYQSFFHTKLKVFCLSSGTLYFLIRPQNPHTTDGNTSNKGRVISPECV